MKNSITGIAISVFMVLISLTAIAGSRSTIRYRSATEISINDKVFKMDGFRFQGKPTKNSTKILSLPQGHQRTIVNFNSDSIASTYNNWYAVFAVENPSTSTLEFKMTPFVRADGVTTNTSTNITTISFKWAGEGKSGPMPAPTYNWGNFSGNDVLVINETIDGSRYNAFSGRVTTVTDSTATSLSIQGIGTIGSGDYLLVAPPGYTDYKYLGSFYMDTAEVRNIADTGTLVKAKMVDLGLTNTIRGSLTKQEIDASGYISPLATGIVIDTVAYLQTTSGGDMAQYFDTDDSSHTVQSTYYYKSTGTTVAVVDHGITIPFAFGQKFYLSTGGSLQGNRDYATFSVTGWIEP